MIQKKFLYWSLKIEFKADKKKACARGKET